MPFQTFQAKATKVRKMRDYCVVEVEVDRKNSLIKRLWSLRVTGMDHLDKREISEFLKISDP